jgi:spore coat protein CotF
MKSLRDLLKDHEKKLQELTSPAYEGATTPEVRAILVETCKRAIEQLKQDIEEEANAVD